MAVDGKRHLPHARRENKCTSNRSRLRIAKVTGSARVIIFDSRFSLFVGPNAGGKSNTLDIITVLLRRLLSGYTIAEGNDQGTNWIDINVRETFTELNRVLDRHAAKPNAPLTIDLTLATTAVDAANVTKIVKHRQDFLALLRNKFRNHPFGNLAKMESWDPLYFAEGSEFSFKLIDKNLQPTTNNDAHSEMFHPQWHKTLGV